MCLFKHAYATRDVNFNRNCERRRDALELRDFDDVLLVTFETTFCNKSVGLVRDQRCE